MLLNATTRRDAAGQIVGVVGVGQDITAMKAVQAEQQRVAADLQVLIDTANAPIFGMDKQGLVNEWNRKAAQIMGYAKEEVMGQPLVETYITPEFQESVRTVLQNALAGEQTDNYGARRRHAACTHALLGSDQLGLAHCAMLC